MSTETDDTILAGSRNIRRIDALNDEHSAKIAAILRERDDLLAMRAGMARRLNRRLLLAGHKVDDRVEIDGHLWQVVDGNAEAQARYIGAEIPTDDEPEVESDREAMAERQAEYAAMTHTA